MKEKKGHLGGDGGPSTRSTTSREDATDPCEEREETSGKTSLSSGA